MSTPLQSAAPESQQPGFPSNFTGEQSTVKKPGNGLGLAALIIGIVALALAFIPAINLVAGFIGFVGLVLGVTAIFLKGKSRGVAIAGTVVSFIAIILGIIMSVVYATVFVAAFDNAIKSDSSISEPNAAVAGDAPKEKLAADVGTRNNPAPFGSTITIEEFGTPTWEVTLGTSTLNATDQVKAANQFNADPEPGNAYAIFPATVKYIGSKSGSPNFSLDFTYVSADGRSYDGGFVTMDGQLSDVADLYPDASATANVIIEIPTTSPEAGVWGVSYIGGDPVFIAVQ